MGNPPPFRPNFFQKTYHPKYSHCQDLLIEEWSPSLLAQRQTGMIGFAIFLLFLRYRQACTLRLIVIANCYLLIAICYLLFANCYLLVADGWWLKNMTGFLSLSYFSSYSKIFDNIIHIFISTT